MADIVTRAGKGSELTHAEMDSNFNEVASLKESSGGGSSVPYVYEGTFLKFADLSNNYTPVILTIPVSELVSVTNFYIEYSVISSDGYIRQETAQCNVNRSGGGDVITDGFTWTENTIFENGLNVGQLDLANFAVVGDGFEIRMNSAYGQDEYVSGTYKIILRPPEL